MNESATAKNEIDQLIATFFALFTNEDGRRPDVGRARELFVREGRIAKCLGSAPEIMTLDELIEPRQQLLTDGTLIEFAEVEISENTRVWGHIAQRFSFYEKRGVLHGAAFHTRGVKTFQLVDTPAGWRILSMAWDDEPTR